MKLSVLVASLLAMTANSKSIDIKDLEVLEVLNGVPQGWVAMGSPDAGQRMPFRIALNAQNEELFHQTLDDISNPFHERYGQHLSKLEMRDLIKPSSEASQSVMTWLKQAGIREADIEDDGDWIKFTTTVEHAEQMLGCTFSTFQNEQKDVPTVVRTLEYSIPRELHEHISFISPTTRFTQIRPQFSLIHDKKVISDLGVSEAINTSCNEMITPACLQDLYNIQGYTPSSDPQKSGFFGVNGFLTQYARYSDLTKFIARYAPYAKGANFSWTSVNGGQLDQNSLGDSSEANLDIQYTVSLSYPLHNNFYSTAGLGQLVPDLDQPSLSNNQNEPYLEFFTYLSGLKDSELPHTLSTSYGEDEQSVPVAYSKKVCNMIGALGGRGVSVIFSSGDTGVGSACQTNDGKNTTRFLPIFPAACPYVTSVGGTHGIEPETAVSFSSGGFSDRWSTPSWQESAVKGYLKILGDQWKGLYNPKGRGFPDVAAQGLNFQVFEKGHIANVDGTSASAPVFSAVIALLNSARLETGLKPLGFLNPWLYKVAVPALNDITHGGSTGCTGTDNYSGLPSPYVPYASWNATKGWDPVTGLGTPDFTKLLALARQGGSKTPLPSSGYKRFMLRA